MHWVGAKGCKGQKRASKVFRYVASRFGADLRTSGRIMADGISYQEMLSHLGGVLGEQRILSFWLILNFWPRESAISLHCPLIDRRWVIENLR